VKHNDAHNARFDQMLAERKECPVHDFQRHGQEAQELRNGIEKILERAYDGRRPNWRRDLQALLDRTDARDSLAYLERKQRRSAHTKSVPRE
jgi:hypothetical protein